MVVYITGASGYLGKALALYFAQHNHRVIALCRRNVFEQHPIQHSRYALGETLNASLPQPDLCIHCAYDFSKTTWTDIYETNVLGSSKLFTEMANRGCAQVIYISSMSAFEGCRSKYGQAKLSTEKILEKYKGISIRPGLIIGGENTGLAGKLAGFSSRKVVPMIGKGNFSQYLTPVQPLVSTIYDIAVGKYPLPPQPITLSGTKPVMLRNFVTTRHAGDKKYIIPIPWQLPFYGLKLLEALGLPLAFRSDSITGLVFSNPTPDFSFMSDHNISLAADLT